MKKREICESSDFVSMYYPVNGTNSMIPQTLEVDYGSLKVYAEMLTVQALVFVWIIDIQQMLGLNDIVFCFGVGDSYIGCGFTNFERLESLFPLTATFRAPRLRSRT
jgi:hypothetical protein